MAVTVLAGEEKVLVRVVEEVVVSVAVVWVVSVMAENWVAETVSVAVET